MSEPIRTYPCPNCRKLVRWSEQNPFRPFCSQRCRLVDFGAWAGEHHRIPGEPLEGTAAEDEDPDEHG